MRIKQYKNRQKKWDAYHRFERDYNKNILRRLSSKDCYKLLDSFYQLHGSIAGSRKFDKLDMDTVESLYRVHSMFGKVSE